MRRLPLIPAFIQSSILVLAVVALTGCAGYVRPPETWSLAHLPAANLREIEQSPAFRVELMIALRVASERCAGPNARILNRMDTETFGLRADPELFAFGGREMREVIGQDMGFEYRRAYGDVWWTVLSDEMRQTRAKYETHPDPAQFCRVAEETAQLAFLMRGSDQIRHLGRKYRQLAPANAKGS